MIPWLKFDAPPCAVCGEQTYDSGDRKLGFPHAERERLFAVAYAGCDARPEVHQDGPVTAGGGGAAADTARDGRHEGWTQPAREFGRSDVAERGAVDWGRYETAVRRWEHVTGRPAPDPTEPGRSGPRLNPRFVEWLMGLAAGWVTDVPGVGRVAALRLLGNGVVPQQAEFAVRHLVERSREGLVPV